MNGKRDNGRKSWGYALLQAMTVVAVEFLVVFIMMDACQAQPRPLGELVADREIVQVSPDIGYSSGDNNDIVKVSYRNGGVRYAYQINGTDLRFQISGMGYCTGNSGKTVVTINSLDGYHPLGTEILSVGYSDKREAYLVTIRTGNGNIRSEWLDFKSSVFKELVAMEVNHDKWGDKPEPGKMARADGTEVTDNITGIDFHIEN